MMPQCHQPRSIYWHNPPMQPLVWRNSTLKVPAPYYLPWKGPIVITSTTPLSVTKLAEICAHRPRMAKKSGKGTNYTIPVSGKIHGNSGNSGNNVCKVLINIKLLCSRVSAVTVPSVVRWEHPRAVVQPIRGWG